MKQIRPNLSRSFVGTCRSKFNVLRIFIVHDFRTSALYFQTRNFAFVQIYIDWWVFALKDVVVGETTYQLTKDIIEYEALGAKELKGKELTVNSYLAIRLK